MVGFGDKCRVRVQPLLELLKFGPCHEFEMHTFDSVDVECGLEDDVVGVGVTSFAHAVTVFEIMCH